MYFCPRTAFFLRCRRGASAVEFALLGPTFLALLFGIVVFGSYVAMVSGVEQLVAEAARAAVGGVSDAERTSLAQANIALHVGAYPFIDPTRLTIVSSATDPTTNAFAIVVRYDASNSALFKLPFVPTPAAAIVRSASIQRGGY